MAALPGAGRLLKSMMKLSTKGSIKVVLLFAAVGLLGACAGSPPDYSQRTKFAVAKQNSLTEWLVQDVNRSTSKRIVAPLCSSAAGHPPTGWGIEDSNWCAVACPSRSSAVSNQWTQTSDGLRCFATDQAANSYISTEFQNQHWNLEQLVLFNGFDRSFVSDTEWSCKEQEYQIDPNTHRGFWVDISDGNSYRFYNDGALMVASAGAPMKLAGDWRGKQGSGVIVNDQLMFNYAVNYGGGRFDEFRSATRKQLCRFVDHPEPRI